VRAVITRVSSASVIVDGRAVGEIERGLLVLLGVAHADTTDDADALAKKIVELRIFPDEDGAMNLALSESGGAVLVVSQFTLLGDAWRGRRPSFIAAANPHHGQELYDHFVDAIKALGPQVETGMFGATMTVLSANEGPVTILMDTTKLF
jgi:D-tyrosyl-tRNA(Tyr) deacylase